MTANHYTKDHARETNHPTHQSNAKWKLKRKGMMNKRTKMLEGDGENTYSATSGIGSYTDESLIHNEQGGTQPPLLSSSTASNGVIISGTI